VTFTTSEDPAEGEEDLTPVEVPITTSTSTSTETVSENATLVIDGLTTNWADFKTQVSPSTIFEETVFTNGLDDENKAKVIKLYRAVEF